MGQSSLTFNLFYGALWGIPQSFVAHCCGVSWMNTFYFGTTASISNAIESYSWPAFKGNHLFKVYTHGSPPLVNLIKLIIFAIDMFALRLVKCPLIESFCFVAGKRLLCELFYKFEDSDKPSILQS